MHYGEKSEKGFNDRISLVQNIVLPRGRPTNHSILVRDMTFPNCNGYMTQSVRSAPNYHQFSLFLRARHKRYPPSPGGGKCHRI